jgi:hypothetical protein
MFTEAVDQPLPLAVDEGVIDGGAAEIDASCDSHVSEYIATYMEFATTFGDLKHHRRSGDQEVRKLFQKPTKLLNS